MISTGSLKHGCRRCWTMLVVWIYCSMILCLYFEQCKNKVDYTTYNLAKCEEQVQCYLYNSSSLLYVQGDHMWRSIRCVKSVFSAMPHMKLKDDYNEWRNLLTTTIINQCLVNSGYEINFWQVTFNVYTGYTVHILLTVCSPLPLC